MVLLFVIPAVLVAVLTMVWWMPTKWYRALLYPGGRLNAISRRMNLFSAWLGSRGIAPTLMVTLETRGRRTGKTLRVPMVVAEVAGDRYLVSMLRRELGLVAQRESCERPGAVNSRHH